MNLDTSNNTYRQLIGNGLIYSVPRFQRDYSWEETEWDDLWQDIEALFENDGEDEHYMGYLVLQSKDSKNFDVIDGQQRLTTLSILILAVLFNIKDLIESKVDVDNNKQRLDNLRNTYIGYLDPVTLIAKSKLNLNRNNDNTYQYYLVPLEPAPKRNLKASDKLMREAYEWFYDRVKKRFYSNMSGDKLALFIDSLSDKLFFTVIKVNDELNAYKVFETLNARGVKLSSTDLLKNYLFSVVHKSSSDEHEMNELDDQWEKLVDLIGSGSLPNFLRAYWNSKNKFVRHAELFKRISSKITNKSEVFSLMRELLMNANVYAAFPNPEDELWNHKQRSYVKLLKIFNVKQPYPLLLTAYQKLNESEFTTLLRACMIISFRYNVIGNLSPNEQEKVYNRVSIAVSNGEYNNLYDILRYLEPIYVSDNKFNIDFSDKIFRTTIPRNKKIVRYILFKIDNHVSQKALDYDSAIYDIEHIMPESVEDNWDEIGDREHEQFLYRIGNMTLLKSSINRELGNSSFDTKKEKYRESEFQITRRIEEQNETWDPSRIKVHQEWLATQATAIWRISQLDY